MCKSWRQSLIKNNEVCELKTGPTVSVADQTSVATRRDKLKVSLSLHIRLLSFAIVEVVSFCMFAIRVCPVPGFHRTVHWCFVFCMGRDDACIRTLDTKLNWN